jgi:hypothetical protein
MRAQVSALAGSEFVTVLRPDLKSEKAVLIRYR